MEIWKEHFSYIKMQKETKFTKCSVYDRLRNEIALFLRDDTTCDELKQHKVAYYKIVFQDRREYRWKREMSTQDPQITCIL